ncbi:MAG: CheR family methyltransferase [Thermodesulfobacteriota bacterium]
MSQQEKNGPDGTLSPDSEPTSEAAVDTDRKNDFHIVGIGTSAGGLNALKNLFGRLSKDTGMAYVVIVHLSPDRESHLTEILQPHCPVPVQQVTETVALEPDRIFIIPPNANLNTIDTHLQLSKLEEMRRERAPIDHFLRTLAETHGEQAVGIILTGTGSDGTLGLRQIKEHGGLTIAQDPEEADFDGMPRSAIASGAVDLILTIEKMPEHILRFARTRPQVPAAAPQKAEPEDAERVLQKIFAHIRTVSGRDFSHYKRSTIMRRIRRRMQLNQVENIGRYLQTLRNNREEVRSLADDLLITVTDFFRDPETFALLEQDVIPQLFEGKSPEDQVRVWTVGCSTGEEAYSLAILLMEEAGRREDPPQIQVFASDLHESALKKAREGVYPESIRTDISEDRLRRFFTKEDSSFRIRKHVRELVLFAPHNLLRDPPFAHLDLITCRNLLIYLQRDAQRDAATVFHYALNRGGYLLLGSSESLEHSDLFVSRNKEHCLYRRREVPTRELRLAPGPLGFKRNESGEPPARSGELRPGFGSIHEKMVERYAPPSILVNANHEVVHYSAHAGRYLQLPGGEPTNNLFKLVREPLRIELRAALHAARKRGAPARSKPIPMRIEADSRQVVVRVRAVEENDLQDFYLVIFDEIDPPPEDRNPIRYNPDGCHRQRTRSRTRNDQKAASNRYRRI